MILKLNINIKRNYIATQMQTVEDPVHVRSTIVKHLNKRIENDVISRNIEKSIFNYSLEKAEQYKIIKRWDNPFFVQVYLDKFKMLYFTLEKQDVLDKIKNKTIKSSEFAYKTHQEIYPEKWESMMEDRRIRMENKYFPKIEASTDTFQCRKCKSNKCTYTQVQTRGADEPMSTFVTCLNCSQRWRC